MFDLRRHMMSEEEEWNVTAAEQNYWQKCDGGRTELLTEMWQWPNRTIDRNVTAAEQNYWQKCGSGRTELLTEMWQRPNRAIDRNVAAAEQNYWQKFDSGRTELLTEMWRRPNRTIDRNVTAAEQNYWQKCDSGRTELLTENTDRALLRLPQIPKGQAWDRTSGHEVRGQRPGACICYTGTVALLHRYCSPVKQVL